MVSICGHKYELVEHVRAKRGATVVHLYTECEWRPT